LITGTYRVRIIILNKTEIKKNPLSLKWCLFKWEILFAVYSIKFFPFDKLCLLFTHATAIRSSSLNKRKRNIREQMDKYFLLDKYKYNFLVQTDIVHGMDMLHYDSYCIVPYELLLYLNVLYKHYIQDDMLI